MSANVAKLLETLQYIESLPNVRAEDAYPIGIDVFDQYTYGTDNSDITNSEHCGTAACFAGWRYLLDGHTPGELFDVRCDIISEASSSLGLDSDTAMILFSSNNTLDDLRMYVGALVANPDMTYEEFRKLQPPAKPDRA